MFNCEHGQTLYSCLSHATIALMHEACIDVDHTYQTSVAMGGQKRSAMFAGINRYQTRHRNILPAAVVPYMHRPCKRSYKPMHVTLTLTNKTCCSLVSSVCFEWSEIFYVICNPKVLGKGTIIVLVFVLTVLVDIRLHCCTIEFLLGAHVCILPLHGGRFGVQQRTVVIGEKALSLSLWCNAQSYASKSCIILKMLLSVL